MVEDSLAMSSLPHNMKRTFYHVSNILYKEAINSHSLQKMVKFFGGMYGKYYLAAYSIKCFRNSRHNNKGFLVVFKRRC